MMWLLFKTMVPWLTWAMFYNTLYLTAFKKQLTTVIFEFCKCHLDVGLVAWLGGKQETMLQNE